MNEHTLLDNVMYDITERSMVMEISQQSWGLIVLA